MKLGISCTLEHTSPEEWAQKHAALGLEAVVFPVDHTASTAVIDGYVKAAGDAGLLIAEVGAWSNPLSTDKKAAAAALSHCIHQTELADYVGANCCVNIAGAIGEVWDGSYPENYSPAGYEAIVRSVQTILDTAKPTRTFYALEPMPHILPDSPENYLRLIEDIDRPQCGAHLDLINMIASPRLYYENRSLTDRSFALLGKHIRSCHLKDAILDHSLTVCIRETPCGRGGVDLRYYVQKADECDPSLPMIIEHLPTTKSYMESVHYFFKTIRPGA